MQYYVLLLLVLAVFVVLAFLLPSSSQISGLDFIGMRPNLQASSAECGPRDSIKCTTPEGLAGYKPCENGKFSPSCYVANVNDCPIDETMSANVCCVGNNNILYECNDKTFDAGEYVVTKLNMQKAVQESGTGWESYKACNFNKMQRVKSQIPDFYFETTAFVDEENNVDCSTAVYTKDFHEGTADGLVPAGAGSVQLVEWRIYPPDTDLSSAENALKYYDLSVPVFSFEVNVSA